MSTKRAIRAAAAITAVLALVSCGAGPTAATGGMEQLASAVGCDPQIQTDAEEIRQALCEIPSGRFVLLTFASEGGEREWLDVAADYGGYYLVGPRWVAVGHLPVVTGLRDQLGGALEEGVSHQHP